MGLPDFKGLFLRSFKATDAEPIPLCFNHFFQIPAANLTYPLLPLQLPHFTKELAEKAQAAGVETVFDLVEMEDDAREALLQFSESQLADVARVCNRYPNVDLSYEVVDAEEVTAGEAVTVQVMTSRLAPC